MAENSPSKLRFTNSSVMYHPYGRNKSPAKPLQENKSQLTVATTKMSEGNFFSFSGGSSSLFPPAQGPVRPAMTEISNLLKHSSIKNPKAGIKKVEPEVKKGPEGKSVSIGSKPKAKPALPPKPVPPPKPQRKVEADDEKENAQGANTQRTLPAGGAGLPRNIAQLFAPIENLPRIVTRGILTERKDPFYDFPEYSSEIIKYWLGYEKRSRPKHRYMAKQLEISHRMRTILVDWMVEVGMEYNTHAETIFLAVSCLDRFLSKMSAAKNKLQLIGTAALFICTKYEEIQSPDIGDFVYITDETYTKEQILQMELIILNVLKFDLMAPTAYDFVRSFASILKLDSPMTCLAMYLTELTLMDGERYLHYLPSVLATAAIALARYTFQGLFWDEQLKKLSTLTLQDIQPCSQHLFNSFYEAPGLAQTAIYDKYRSVRFCCISKAILPAKMPWS